MSLRFLRALSPVFLVVLLLGTPLHVALAAEDFERALRTAVQLYDELDYERALSQLKRVRTLAKGDAQVLSVDMHEGIFLAALGRWTLARTAFENAFLLDVSAKLPLDVSPKMQREVEAIRQAVTQRRAAEGSSASSLASAADRPEQPPASSTRLLPSRVAMPPASARLAPASRSVPMLSFVLLGSGVLLAGGGTFFGVQSHRQLEEARREPLEEPALAKLGAAQGAARGANVLWCAAGMAVAGAVVTWFLQPTPSSPAAARTQGSAP